MLFVAAQTGFVGGPQIMSVMAVDSWLPRRFATLSERLTMQNGVMVMGVSALALLLLTRGSVGALVVMYAINVFLTFTLSQFSMIKHYIKTRSQDNKWLRHISIFAVGFILCATILTTTVIVKFLEGAWVTVLITSMALIDVTSQFPCGSGQPTPPGQPGPS